jgi:hypothetical protein
MLGYTLANPCNSPRITSLTKFGRIPGVAKALPDANKKIDSFLVAF